MDHQFVDSILRNQIAQEVEKILPGIIDFRHLCHKKPELSWNEKETASRVAEQLKKLGLTPTVGVGRLGVTAVIEGAHPGPTVGLRADMDALPIQEQSTHTYKSEKDGVMHACGHDGHMANLLGAAQILVQRREQLHGRVKLIFQPAEEGGAGAEVMCQDGVLENPKVDVIFGLHGWPEVPCGHIYVKTGAMLAATSEFTITIDGTGCHAATPHLGTDQVLIAARLIDSLQSIKSRAIPPADPMVLSVTQIQGGTASNIIPKSVRLGGTLRTISEATRDLAVSLMKKMVRGFEETYGVQITFDYQHNYPPTLNHVAPTRFIEKLGRELFTSSRVHELAAPSMGGEDFAYFLRRIPGCYFFLGMDDGRQGRYPSLHHPAYDFNDHALPVGIQMFVHAALSYYKAQALPDHPA